MHDLVATWGPVAAAALQLAVSAGATGHVLLHKQQARAAVGWIGLIWLAPLVGVVLYLLFGINRIDRKVARLGVGSAAVSPHAGTVPDDDPRIGHLGDLTRAVGRISGRPLRDGNAVTLLENGDAAYPAMLDAIAGATRSVALCTYLFDRDAWGRRFVDALADAADRGVAVRVLVDGIGALYSAPPITWDLHRRGVPVARFLWSWWPGQMAYLNLRNHRKLCVVDGRIAFTGGMNLRGRCVLAEHPDGTRDLHARVEGPVVADLLRVFAHDWRFTTGESLDGPGWWPEPDAAGPILARALPDGPDEDFGVARWTLHAAVQSATRRIRVATPYFLPEGDLVAALSAAALRGIDVDVVLPAETNLPYVAWATAAELPALLRHGVRVWQARPPFFHTKLLVVDDRWVHLGSANWDPRSLRLNFELNLECIDPDLADQADRIVGRLLDGAAPITLDTLAQRGLLRRLRDGAARLLHPYL